MQNTNFKLRIGKGEVKAIDKVWVFDKPGMKENIEVKAVVEDGGELNLKGKIVIAKNVTGIEAFMNFKVLLLGNKAKAIVTPELEIESNDVKASHAASIGQVDVEQVTYLQQRGFNREEAVTMIVEAFLNEEK